MKKLANGNVCPDDLDYTDASAKYKTLGLADHKDDVFYTGADEELCWSCGWTSYNQNFSSYGSRLRIMHALNNTGLWAVGTRWMIRDEPNDRFLGNNYMTLKFLNRQPGLTIPMPQVRSLSEAGDAIYFTVESRMSGDTLWDVWDTSTKEERDGYVRQLADAFRQLRQFTAPRPQKVDGSQLDDLVVADCEMGPGRCFKIPYNADEWLDGFGADLRIGLAKLHQTTDPVVIEEKYRELKASFPSSGPYVLSHADCHLRNVFVKDGRVQGIVDWKRAGYYPWWVERWITWQAMPEEMHQQLWAELEPEIDEDKFQELVISKVIPAVQAFLVCGHDHLPQMASWLKPDFCGCKKHGGEFRTMFWGKPISCQVRKLPPELEALLAGYNRKDPWATDQKKIESKTATDDDDQPEA